MDMLQAGDVGLSAAGLSQLDAVMQSYVDQKKVAGMVYAVFKGRHLVHEIACGLAEIETGTPMRPDSRFCVASMTKPITAAAVMMLVEDGLLALDDPVSRFIPKFDAFEVLVDPAEPSGAREPLARSITVRDLLANTSGLACGIFEDAPIEGLYGDARLEVLALPELAETLPTLPLEFQPGTSFRYAMGYDVLGYLVELASGQAFDRFLQQRLFLPLGMVGTEFVLPELESARVPAIYDMPEVGGAMRAVSPETRVHLPPVQAPLGGRGLISTLNDYARFLQMMQGHGELDGVRVLLPGSVAAMTTNQLPAGMIPIGLNGIPLDGTGWGLGFGVCMEPGAWGGGSPAGTYWWMGSYGTHAWVDPQNDFIGLFMTQAAMYLEPGIVFRNLVYQAVAGD